MAKAFDIKSKKRRSVTPESEGVTTETDTAPSSAQNDVPPAEFYDSPPPTPPSKSLTIVNLLLAIVLIGLLFTSGLLYQRSRNSTTQEATTTDTASSSSVRDQLATSQTPQIAEESTPAVEPVITTPPTPSAISLRVLNGSGQSGAAQRLADQLKAAGYTVSSVGNAKRFSYKETTIFYHSGKKAAAEAVAAVLNTSKPLLEEENTVTTDVDIVVVAGP